MDSKQSLHLKISIVIPTAERPEALRRTLQSVAAQEVLPAELICVDASRDDASQEIANAFAASFKARDCVVRWVSADVRGAAAQRNQGVAIATQPFIALIDDDIVLEKGCLNLLLKALFSDPCIGGVNAMMTNEHYRNPGFITRCVFWILANEKRVSSYAGRVIGPAVTILWEDREDLPEVVPSEWLNTGCVLYRREALPNPPFSPNFTGYSMLEDLALSLRVAQHWKLANARTARIFHDNQPGNHKSDACAVARMELVNRYYVMAHVMHRRSAFDYLKLAIWEIFQLTACAVQSRGGISFWHTVKGKYLGGMDIMREVVRRRRAA
jgi:GT2 family glycosyltransferase